VIDVDFELAAFQIGSDLEPDYLCELQDRVEKLPNGKYWIGKFIYFQYSVGNNKHFSPNCKPHALVLELLEKNGLTERVADTLPKGLGKGPRKRKGKGQDKAFAEGMRSRPPTLEELKAYAKEVPCSEDCAEGYQNDRQALNWTKVKGGLQVTIEDWRSDLRTFAMHWRANEAKRKAEGRSAPVARGVDTRPEKRLKL